MSQLKFLISNSESFGCAISVDQMPVYKDIIEGSFMSGEYGLYGKKIPNTQEDMRTLEERVHANMMNQRNQELKMRAEMQLKEEADGKKGGSNNSVRYYLTTIIIGAICLAIAVMLLP